MHTRCTGSINVYIYILKNMDMNFSKEIKYFFVGCTRKKVISGKQNLWLSGNKKKKYIYILILLNATNTIKSACDPYQSFCIEGFILTHR